MRFPDGIDAQPEVLARSATAVKDGLAGIPAPAPGELLGLVGVGANEHVARSAGVAWRRLGLRAFALPAAELVETPGDIADVYVGLSESGRSTETLDALADRTGRRVGVTNVADSPLAALAEEVLLLDSGPDSPVYTTGYTATLQAVGMLGEHWAGRPGDWSALPDQAASVLASARPVVEQLADRFERARLVDVVAGAPAAATAGEGALLLREAARAHTAGHETRSYLHGPMEPVDAQTACIVVGDGREVPLARQLAELGAAVLLVTTRDDVAASGDLGVVRLPVHAGQTSGLALAVLQILPVQVLGWTLASGRGLAVDGFRYEQTDTKAK